MPDPIDLNFVTTDVAGGSVLQWATPFTNVKDLVDKAIAKLKPGECIRRLVIAGHGAVKNDGYMCFDVETTGSQYIDGSNKKQPLSPAVLSELPRLKAHFCKDAIIEFRVCRFGIGKNGQKAMQAVADAVGVAVTAPTDSIYALGLVGGLSIDWRVAYPRSWGLPSRTSFWRGGPTRPPHGAPDQSSIAPISAQMVPLNFTATPAPANTFLTPPASLPAIRKVSIANPNPSPVWPRAALLGTAVVAVPILALLSCNFVSWPFGPTVQPTSAPVVAAATPAPALVVPTPTPSPTPTKAPTATPAPSAPPPASASPTATVSVSKADLIDGMYVVSCIRLRHTAWGGFVSYLDWLMEFADYLGLGPIDQIDNILITVADTNGGDPVELTYQPDPVYWGGRFGLSAAGPKEIISVEVRWKDGSVTDVTELVVADVGEVIDVTYPKERNIGDCKDAPKGVIEP